MIIPWPLLTRGAATILVDIPANRKASSLKGNHISAYLIIMIIYISKMKKEFKKLSKLQLLFRYLSQFFGKFSINLKHKFLEKFWKNNPDLPDLD